MTLDNKLYLLPSFLNNSDHTNVRASSTSTFSSDLNAVSSNTNILHNNGSRPNTPNVNENTSASILDTMPLKMRQLRKRSISHNSGSGSDQADKYLTKLPVGIQRALDPNKKPTPLDELIRAASIQNPKQFELPRELELNVQFPGYDRGKILILSDIFALIYLRFFF